MSVALLTVLLIAPSCGNPADPTNLYLIALMGQSNMSGRGKVSELPADFPRNRGNIWSFTNANKWEPAREPVDSPLGQLDAVSKDKQAGVGPSLAIADAFVSAHPATEVGLIPCAKGGSRMAEWLKDSSSRQRDTLFGSCIHRIKTVDPTNGDLRAVIFWQGAADAKLKDDAIKWNERFTAFVSALRAELKAPDLPIILVVLGSTYENVLQRRPYWYDVREQQLKVDIPGVIKVEPEAYERLKKDAHFPTEEQLVFGKGLAKLLPDP
jgi:hypothetical protein